MAHDLPSYGAMAVGLIIVKCVWLLVDPAPMLFLGDSESYLATAVTGWLPLDRSFVYGYLVRVFAVWPRSLVTLIAFQSMCSVLAALLMVWTLRSGFKVPAALAFGTALLWTTLEPLALMYERYVMAEAAALLPFALFVALGVRYLDTRALRWLVSAHAAGVAVISLRYSFVPVAWFAVVALPCLAFAASPAGAGNAMRATPQPGWRFLPHLAVSVAAAAAMHHGYKVLHGYLQEQPPAYQYSSGLFLVSAWSPIVQPEDFGDPVLGHKLLDGMDRSKCASGNRRLRDAMLWSPDCLVSRIMAVSGGRATGHHEANAVAEAAALRALRRDPVGVASLAIDSWTDWFDTAELTEGMRWDRYSHPYPPSVLEALGTYFGVDGADWPYRSTPSNRWYFANGPWLMLLAASPLIMWWVVVVAPVGTRGAAVWIALVATCLVGVGVGAATKLVPRYMHAVAWLMVLCLGVMASRASAAARRAMRSSPE